MYIFDIDGTLSKPGERLKYLQKKPKNFKAFYDGMLDDEVNESITTLYETLYDHADKELAIVTGRPERYRKVTMQWFMVHDIPFRGVAIVMRQDRDYRPDYIVKTEIVKDIGIDSITCIFEDRQQVVDAYRQLGLTVCQVAKGNY